MTDSKLRKWLVPAVIIAVAIGIIALLMASKPKPPQGEPKEKAWLVETEPLQLGSHQAQISLLGTVQSPFDSQLSAVIQADVQTVNVREGTNVKKGQTLLQLDQREINARVLQRQADVQELRAALAAENTRHRSDLKALKEEQRLLKVAQDAFKRQAKLKSSNLIAQERLEQAESAVAQSSLAVNARERAIDDHPNRLKQIQAGLKRAQASLNVAELDLARSTVSAPFDGVVTQVMVAPGDRVQVGQTLIKLFDINEVEIRAQLPDRFIPGISQALSAPENTGGITAKLDYFGQNLEAKLLRLAGQSNAQAGGVDAFFKADTQQNLILNSTIRLYAHLPAINNSFTLPVSAIYGTNRIYKVANERIKAVEVEILGTQLTQGKRSRVIVAANEHLNAGDLLVTTQLPNAISGLKVTLKNADPAKEARDE